MKRILSLTLVVVMLLSCLAVLSACGDKADVSATTTTTVTPPPTKVDCNNHVDADGDFLCDTPGCGMPVKKAGNYTYNTYMSEFPSMWNPHRYETATEGEILGYTTLGFYTFDYNEDKTGFVVVPEMATQMPIDVTADYAAAWDIDPEETARAWKIVIRDDLKWEDGTPITAYDFVESAKRLLDPASINHRADSLYSGNLKVVGAKNYFYGGRTVTAQGNSAFSSYSESLDTELVFTLAAPSADTNNQEIYFRSWYGFPASYDAAKTAAYLEANEFPGTAFTAAVAAKMEGKTLAEIKADAEMKAAWDVISGWFGGYGADARYLTLNTKSYDVTTWDTVGLLAVSDHELVVVIEDELSGFYLNYSLTGDFGLVHIPTYDACAGVDENGVYTNTYGTSVDTFKSYGPYKLTTFELDSQIVLETNLNWYGYYDTARAGQYMTTKIVYDCVQDPDVAMEMFLQGKLDSKGLDTDYITQYTGSTRIYYTDGASTWFIALNPNESAFAKWEADHEGYDKSILTMKEFRMALSFSLDRQNFINTLDPTGSIAYGLYNNMICSNPDLGVMYREEEAAKDALLAFWGIPQEQIGPGKWFPTKDKAIESITGYDLEGAKKLFDQAYDAAVDAGIYDGNEKIHIIIGTPNNTSKFYSKGYDFLVKCWTEAVKGTKLEGLLVFENDHTLGDSFSDALKANTVDMLFGVGWSGSQLDPYGLIEAYTTPNYQYDPSWNTAAAMMDFVADNGVTYRASVLDWTYIINGETKEIQIIGDDGMPTGDVEDFSCGTNDKRPEERIRLLAAIEKTVLEQYDMIPTHNQSSASLLGYQVEYGNQEYVYGLGRGGIQYMTYNYTDEAWADYIAAQGGILEY